MAGTATATGPKRARKRSRASARRRGWLAAFAGIRATDAEAVLVLALFAAALAARWPYLLRLPHFTDEIGEIRWALDIYDGIRLPLTAQVKYFGPLNHYLLAGLFHLVGPSILLPRLVIAVIGGLTVALTYLLGRELGGWRVGALGAALLATLPQHIVVNSHVAWQNSTTPFYSTLACYALLRALRAFAAPGTARVPAWGRWLLLAGLAFGLMLQTHLGTALLGPALALAALIALWHTADRRASFRRFFAAPWPYLAAVLAVVAYSPVLIDNARSGWAGFIRAQGRDYAYVKDPTLADYLANLRDLLFELMRMLGDPFTIPEHWTGYFTSWQLVVPSALCLGGLVVLARQRRWLPLPLLLATALIMPRFNHAYGVDGDRYLVTGRYVAFLLPPLAVAMAAGALALATWLLGHIPQRWRDMPLRPLAASIPLALIALLILAPIAPLRAYYAQESSVDPDNATFLETVRFVQQARGARTPVLIDEYMAKIDLKDGADALEILYILFRLEGIPYRIVADPGAELARLGPTLDPNDTEALPIVVMMYDRCYPLRDTVPLQQISGRFLLRELYWTKPSFYAVYRYAPPPQKAGCYPP